MVRDGANGGLEEHIPVNRDKQKVGLPVVEGRSMGYNSKPLVEVFNGHATSTSAADDKLKVVSNRIKHADFGKIVVRGIGGMDSTSDNCEENLGDRTNRWNA
nr:hypothetical protein CFP56_71975 [Quercus suber]